MTETVAAIIDERLDDVLKARPLEVERAWQELARIYRSQLRDHENRIAALERILKAMLPPESLLLTPPASS